MATPVAKIGAVEYTDLHEALVAGSTAGSVVELLCDVDLKGKNWEPITDFAGTFDGKGFKISNLTITAESGNAGLFASLAGTTILRNFTIENVAIDAANGRAGAVTASCGSPCAVISNITVCGAIDIKGKEYVGALFGHAEYSHIADCHVDGGDAATSKVIASAKIGGIFGQPGEDTVVVIGCTVKNITIEATATGDAKVGAIAGRFNCDNSLINCSAENCIIKCAQPGATTIGGLVGRFENGAVGYILNTTAKNVELQIAGETVAYKDFGDLVSQKVAVGTDVVGNLDFAKNYQFTAGTFTPYGDCLSVINDKGAEVGLKSKIATGYAPIANGDGTYTITAVYAITIPDSIQNGTLETSVTNNIVAGTEVTVTATPDANYELESITTNGTAITGTTFVMPAENVTVEATFKSTATPGWSEDPTKDVGKAADEVYPAIADSSVLAKVDAGTLGGWAKANSVDYNDFIVDPDTFENAFLLNCAPGEVETEKAKFKFTEIVPGMQPTIGEAGKYGNGKVVVYGATKLGADADWAVNKEGATFYKAELVPVQFNENAAE